MPQAQIMTLDEKLEISNRALDLLDAGDSDGYDRLMKTIPLPPYLAKIAKEKIGPEFFIRTGWNLSEVEAEVGQTRLNN